MSKYRLSPMEILQLEKKQLKEERDILEKRLSYRMQYLAYNWGSMVSRSLTDVINKKANETVNNFTQKSPIAIPLLNKMVGNPILNLLISFLPQLGSVAWKLTKPTIITWGVKKLVSSIFRRRKKK